MSVVPLGSRVYIQIVIVIGIVVVAAFFSPK